MSWPADGQPRFVVWSERNFGGGGGIGAGRFRAHIADRAYGHRVTTSRNANTRELAEERAQQVAQLLEQRSEP